MDKHRIEGRHATTSWHPPSPRLRRASPAKSSGSRVEVNAAVVRGSIVPLPGEICRERSRQKSADAIVVERTSRSAMKHSKVAGGLSSTKGRTEPCPNRETDAPADNASRRGMDESRFDGKHVDIERGPGPCVIGTAQYGPVRWVVWDPWLALASQSRGPDWAGLVALQRPNRTRSS